MLGRRTGMFSFAGWPGNEALKPAHSYHAMAGGHEENKMERFELVFGLEDWTPGQ